MDNELEQLDIKMKKELHQTRDKYNNLKKEVKKKYKKDKPKLMRISIPKTVKDKLWDDNFGHDAGIGKCYCCQKNINSKKFDCGHIMSVAKGGTNNIENLKPVCSTCNKSMGTTNMEEFKKEYFEKHKSIDDSIDNMCRGCNSTIESCDFIGKISINQSTSMGQEINKFNKPNICNEYMKRNNVCNGCYKKNYCARGCP